MGILRKRSLFKGAHRAESVSVNQDLAFALQREERENTLAPLSRWERAGVRALPSGVRTREKPIRRRALRCYGEDAKSLYFTPCMRRYCHLRPRSSDRIAREQPHRSGNIRSMSRAIPCFSVWNR